MGCPFHDGDEGESDRGESQDQSDDLEGPDRGIDRRTFMQSALAIGGIGALKQVGNVAGVEPTPSTSERGRIAAGTRMNRQHAWDAFEPTGGSGNTVPPRNSLFLCMDCAAEGEPSPGHRRQVETALAEIERQFDWHPGGVMFTMSYGMPYFDRFDADLPTGAEPTGPGEVASLSEEVTTDDEVRADTSEVILLLASSNVANLLAVESALWGEDDDLDFSFDATFEGIFDRPREFPDRRVGFLGPDLPKDDYQSDLGIDVPEGAPLSMGFIAGFGASMPEEDTVTLERGQRFPAPDVDAADVPDASYVGEVGTRDPGMFAQGTLKHVSHVELDLDAWYEKSHEDRRTRMYSPFHTEEDVGEVGENLTDPADGNPGADEGGDGESVPDLPTRDPDEDDYASRAEETARHGTDETDGTPTLGHSQKVARARYDVDGDGDIEQPVLRRDWDGIVTEGETTAGYHFNIPVRFNESAFSMFEANYNLEFTSLDGRIDHGPVATDEWQDRNGIAPFMTATRRGHFLIPPITLRALPHPQPESVDIDVEQGSDEVVVHVRQEQGGGNAIDDETVQFGAPGAVNRARGARPVDAETRGGDRRYVFDAEAVTLGDEAKLFAKREGNRRAVVGTTTL
jgi:hypothetical protein